MTQFKIAYLQGLHNSRVYCNYISLSSFPRPARMHWQTNWTPVWSLYKKNYIPNLVSIPCGPSLMEQWKKTLKFLSGLSANFQLCTKLTQPKTNWKLARVGFGFLADIHCSIIDWPHGICSTSKGTIGTIKQRRFRCWIDCEIGACSFIAWKIINVFDRSWKLKNLPFVG